CEKPRFRPPPAGDRVGRSGRSRPGHRSHLTSIGCRYPMRLVLFQPDILQNAGTIMRLAACLGAGLDIVEPCGFVLDDRRLRRAGMDYVDRLDWRRWPGWDTYRRADHAGRLILLTTRAAVAYTEWRFRADDRLMVGSES